jgi:hypothetical protein
MFSFFSLAFSKIFKLKKDYRRLYSNPVDKTKGIRCDQIIKLNNHYAAKSYPEKLRRIKYYYAETKKYLNLSLIALICSY